MLLVVMAVGLPATALVASCGKDPVVDAAALQFEAPLVGGGRLDFRTLSGNAVALWFWAPG